MPGSGKLKLPPHGRGGRPASRENTASQQNNKVAYMLHVLQRDMVHTSFRTFSACMLFSGESFCACCGETMLSSGR
jgi:hypothetical protein